jgi:Right handed beta helix region
VRIKQAMAVLAVVFATVSLSDCTTLTGAAGGAILVNVTCKDATSDAAAVQNGIGSSAPGATINILGGICLLTKGISLPGDRTYAGSSTTGTVLEQDAGMTYVLASAAYAGNLPTTGDPLAIRDLTVSCNGSGSTNGIVVLNWQADVEHVDVTDCGGSGIVDTNTTANGRAITNTSVNSRFDNNVITKSGAYGFEVSDSGNAVTDGFLDDNQIGPVARDAIHLGNAAGWVISGNHLYGDGQDGIYASRLFGTTISGNYIEDFGAKQASGAWYGITATAGGAGSTIAGNKVFNDGGETAGARYTYIAITWAGQPGESTGYLSVTGNVIVGARPSDVGFSFSGSPGKLVIASSGNLVATAGTARSSGGNVTVTGGI